MNASAGVNAQTGENAASVIDRINHEYPEGDEGNEDTNNGDTSNDVNAPVEGELSVFAQQVKDAGPDHVWELLPDEIIVDQSRNGRTQEIKASDKDVKELAASIERQEQLNPGQGQLQPGEVSLSSDGKMYLTFGFRRFFALGLVNAKRPKDNQLPFKAFVRLNQDDTAMLSRNFDENDKRRELTVLDKVAVVMRFIDAGKNQKQASELTGYSTASVNNYTKINKFTDKVKGYIRDGRLTSAAAIELVKLSTPEEQEKAAEELITAAPATSKAGAKAAKKKTASVGKASVKQLTVREFTDALDFFFTKSNAKQLHQSILETLRIVADVVQGRATQEKALERLAQYK